MDMTPYQNTFESAVAAETGSWRQMPRECTKSYMTEADDARSQYQSMNVLSNYLIAIAVCAAICLPSTSTMPLV